MKKLIGISMAIILATVFLGVLVYVSSVKIVAITLGIVVLIFGWIIAMVHFLSSDDN